MKILIVIDDYFNKSNGLCISTQRFVHEYRKMGYEVRIVSCNIGGQADYPVKEWVIPFFKKIIAKEGFHMAWPKGKVLRKAVAWADVIQIETPFPISWRAAKYAKKLNKLVIATCHIFPGNITESLHINNTFFNGFFWWFFKHISFRNCDALQCPTKKVKQQLEQHHFKQAKFVISNGISQEFIANPHKKTVGQPFTIICIGRFSKEKHQETLFKALQLAQNGKNFKVIFAGQGPLEAKYQQLAGKLPKRPELKFFSPAELRQTLVNCDLIVHCADVEVEGMACMEAFAAGCVPVIADSPLSSTVDFALSAHNRFPFGNATALAKQLDYWYEHPNEVKKMRASYRDYAKSLTVEVSAQKAIKMINSLR